MSHRRLPYCMIFNPYFPSESLAWVERSLDGLAAVGIKIHPSWCQLYADDPRWKPCWELAAARGVPIITHAWAITDNPVQKFATPERLETYVARYPQVNLVLGHAGGRYEGHLAAARLAQKYPNVYMDIAGDIYAFGALEYLVRWPGPERVLFGSDMNWMDPRTQIGMVLAAPLAPEARRLILGEKRVPHIQAGQVQGVSTWASNAPAESSAGPTSWIASCPAATAKGSPWKRPWPSSAEVKENDATGFDYPLNFTDPVKLKAMTDKFGLKICILEAGIYGERRWKLGSFAATNPATRREAIKLVQECMDVAAELGVEEILLWPGQDGYEYPFQANYEHGVGLSGRRHPRGGCPPQ